MSIEYIGDGFVIDSVAHRLLIEEQQFDIRPKTFELLIYLIERVNTVVSKQELLDNIWDDVTVDEHVVVQSIAELRKAFGDLKVIQTHPRKGYSWIAPVSQREVTNPANVDSPKPNIKSVRLTLMSIGALLIGAALYLATLYSKSEPQNSNRTVYILPTKNNMMDSKFDWVSLGIMDTLISHANDNSQIMPIDFVLSAMQMAKVDRNYDDEQIKRLFVQTGAHTIVESEISRRLGEYQLVYRLHSDNSVERGALFNKSLDDLITTFSNVVGDRSVAVEVQVAIDTSSFNHEMFIEAINLSKTGKSDSAILLMKSVLSIDPDNMHAYRLLIDWLQYKQEFEQALIYSEQALSRLGAASAKASFYYRHGYNYFRLNRLEQAWHYSELLKQQLTKENNPFYAGFAKQLEGEILFAQGHTQQAKSALVDALKQFEQISYSIGLTTVHILLSQVESQLGNQQQASYHHSEAKNVVEKYQIHELLKLFRIELTPDK